MSDKLHEEFQKYYVSLFDLEGNPLISSKIQHMKRVEKIACFLAKKLGIKGMALEAVHIIGLLHDIGRIEQLRDYGTFNDYESVNHADAGVKYLFENGHIFDFASEEIVSRYGRAIEKAIGWHNKILLPEEACLLDESEVMLCKLIRDADKIDIYKIYIGDSIPNRCKLPAGCTGLEVSAGLLDTFYSRNLIDAKKRRGWFDDWLMKVALVFDLNFAESKELLLKTGYLEKFTDNFLQTPCGKIPETVNLINEALNFALEYLKG